MLVPDLEAPAQLGGPHHRAGPTLPSQPVQRQERIGARNPFQFVEERIPVIGADPFVRQIAGEQPGSARDGCGVGEECGVGHPLRKRTIPPGHLVQKLIQAFHRRQKRRPGRLLDGVAGEATQRKPAQVVDAHIAGEHLGPAARARLRICRRLPVPRILAHAYVADDALRQARRQPQPVPPKRQIGGSAFGAGRSARRGHHLEASVEKKRMHLRATAIEALRDRHLADGLTGPRPDLGQRAERRPEIDAHAGLGAVECPDILGFQSRFQAIHVHPAFDFLPA